MSAKETWGKPLHLNFVHSGFSDGPSTRIGVNFAKSLRTSAFLKAEPASFLQYPQ
jgi:hypothetical protein